MPPSDQGEKTGIQSIEVGVPLLKVLADSVGPMTLTALATAAGMPTSKAHKYLVSFIRVGFVSQNSATGRYNLGPFASDLGFAVLRRLDVMELAQDALEELRERLKLTSSLAIWSRHGPIIVRRAENRQLLSVWSELGASMPLLTSASGRIFAAYLQRSETRKLIQAELRLKDGPASHAGLRTEAEVDIMLEEVRNRGVAIIVERLHVGVTSLGAAVMNQNNYPVGALAVVGTAGKVDPAWDGKPARALRQVSAALSRRLGANVSVRT